MAALLLDVSGASGYSYDGVTDETEAIGRVGQALNHVVVGALSANKVTTTCYIDVVHTQIKKQL